MKLNRMICVLSASAMLISTVPFCASAESAELADSGIDYNEMVGTIENPAAGYTSTIWAVCKPGNTPVYSPRSNIVLFFVDISGFSSGANGVKNDDDSVSEGVDYDLDEEFFAAWDTTLQNCRDNGCMAAFRFRYDAEGRDNPEPATFDQVLHHISQLKESRLFEKYADIIAFVESGFVGKWGEQHGGKYVSQDYKARLLEAMLDAVPKPIPVTVRTPDIFAKWAGIERSQLGDRELINSLTSSDYTDDIQGNKDRVGLYDDGYMGSDSDLGTYANRTIETDWLGEQTVTSYFGGEFSGNIEFAKKYDTYLPENAIPEMYKTHLSYINANIFQLYKDYTFDEKCTVDNVDNSAYYGQTAFQFIRDHIGYRYVLRKSELTESVPQGGEVTVDFEVENTGFAGLIPSAQSYVILEKDGVYTCAEADVDCQQWRSCTTSAETLNFRIPDTLPAGEWNICLKLSVGTDMNIRNMAGRSIRFANDGVWRSAIGANRIGTIKVTESAEMGTDNSFRLISSDDTTPAKYYSGNGKTVVDGMETSSYEWTEDMVVGESDAGEKMYVKADEKNLYVMSRINMNGASAPVYNIQLKNPVNGESYWLYYASNGFVYFNHDMVVNSQCRWSNDMVEFCIPFELMGLEPGIEINELRIFMQDSGNGWKLMSDVRTPKAEIPADFCLLSEKAKIRLTEGASYDHLIVAELDGGEKYVWKHNGETIEGAESAGISLRDVKSEDSGEYTVTITSANGIVKTVSAFDLEVAAGAEILSGDANLDGKVSVADAAAILQHLGNSEQFPLKPQGMINADFDGEPGITPKDALAIQLSLIKP